MPPAMNSRARPAILVLVSTQPSPQPIDELWTSMGPRLVADPASAGERDVAAPVVVLRPRTSTAARTRRPSPGLADRLIVEFATAPDVHEGVARLVALLLRNGLDRAEWWAPTDAGRALRLEVADGDGRGPRLAIALGPAGALVLVGDSALQLRVPVAQVSPLLRRRWADEQLAQQVVQLARQNEALADFSSLVAHELKSPLYAALRGPDSSSSVEQALEVVDSILEIARSESAPGATAPAAQCLDEALRDLGPIEAGVVANLPATAPLPPAALRLLFRNLIGNAVAADARCIQVSGSSTAGRCTLLVDDDGVGLTASDEYATGSGLGLNLCRRLVARFGGTLELQPRPRGGTRATLVLAGGV
jgi:signal transduction histidine kinase